MSTTINNYKFSRYSFNEGEQCYTDKECTIVDTTVHHFPQFIIVPDIVTNEVAEYLMDTLVEKI